MAAGNSEEKREMRQVGDIMIPLKDYPHLPVWSTMLEAIEMMDRAELDVGGRKSLPRILLLFDLDGSIAGTVRRRDLMRGMEPQFLVGQSIQQRIKLFDMHVDHRLSELWPDNWLQGIREQVDRPVTDVMRPIERTIDSDELVMTAVYEMVNHDLIILPVIEDRKVVGVIRTVDVFHELAELVL
ncbi:MAG: CBS domain-containing protein [Candidatus Latescibacteria bacterium]|jgi:CBS-domain-containing membrane protein|nr:CBS domain-containing protein [Candidatus Latescibacterota bacterium]